MTTPPLSQLDTPTPPAAATGNVALVPQDVATRVVRDALAPFVGRGRRFSVQQLAAASGVSARSLEGYVAGAATPGLAGLLSLMAVLPPAFADAVLAPAGLHASPADRQTATGFEICAGLGAATGDFAAALADGRIDHREAADLRARLRPLLPSLTGFVEGVATPPAKNC
jgi:hypothetical protein